MQSQETYINSKGIERPLVEVATIKLPQGNTYRVMYRGLEQGNYRYPGLAKVHANRLIQSLHSAPEHCDGCGAPVGPLHQEHFDGLCINCHDEWKSATQREF